MALYKAYRQTGQRIDEQRGLLYFDYVVDGESDNLDDLNALLCIIVRTSDGAILSEEGWSVGGKPWNAPVRLAKKEAN